MSSDDENGARTAPDGLTRRIDDALRDWPIADRSPIAWDEAAERIEHRIRAGGTDDAESDLQALGLKAETGEAAHTLSDEMIFASPLCETSEEVQNSAAFAKGLEKSLPASSRQLLSAATSAKQGRAPGELGSRGAGPRFGDDLGHGQGRAGESGRANFKNAVEAKMGVMGERDRDRRSFQDLAKLASSPSMIPPQSRPSVAPSASGIHGLPSTGSSPDLTAKKDDSGLIDLRAMTESHASLPPHSAAAPSRPTAGLGSAGIFDEETAPPSVVAGSVSMAPPALVQAAVPAVHQAQHAQVNSEPRRGSPVVLMVSGLVTVAAIAAGIFFVVRAPKASDPAATGATPVSAATAAPADDRPAVVAAARPIEAVAPAAGDRAAIDPAAIPAAPGTPVAVAAPEKHVRGAAKGAHAATVAAAGKSDKTESDKPDPKLVANELPASPAVPGALGEAMKQAAGPAAEKQDGPKESDPQFVPGSVPQKPSQGAVTGALGSVLPAARACLGPDDPISRATVVFKAAGGVETITVTGNAVGKPAEGCIKGALLKARVPAFAQDTYTATVTIRPN